MAAVALAILGVAGCGSLAADEVERVGAGFAAGDPTDRCDLLAPATLTSLEQDEAEPCTEAIEQVPVGAGEVTSVEVWGAEAQVRLSDDTLFLTHTAEGWRVSAAGCTPQGEDRPYDCEVEAS
ncbi:hypothetical protein ACI78T_13450 [Blastococcus sp. SYSU D00922]